MINKKIILNFFFKFSFSFKKCILFFFLVFFISFLIFIIYSNNFLLTCQESVFVPPLQEAIVYDFFIINKDLTENYAKNAFMECLAALVVFFEKSESIEPFYYKKIVGKISSRFFSIYLDILLNDSRVSADFKHFLKYLTNPKLQIENPKNFILLFKNFIIEYIKLYEKEWHPEGFNKELQSYKDHITIEEISPLSLKKNKERLKEIEKNLKFFYIYEKDGNFLIGYSEYGQNRLKLLDQLGDQKSTKERKAHFCFDYDRSKNTYIYKLKNVIKHINVIQQILDDLQWRKNINFTIKKMGYNNLSPINLYLENIYSNIKSLYKEIEIERKLIQKLIFIIYYPKAINGDIYFMKKLVDSLIFLDQNKIYKDYAYIKLYINDLREEKTFKHYINFLVNGGVIKYNELNTYYIYTEYFYDLINSGEGYKIFCLKPEDIEHKLYSIINFLKKTRQLENKLAAEYLSKDSVLEIKKKKNYYH